MVSTSKMKGGMTGKETKDLASETLTQLEQHGFDISNKGEVDRLIDATVKEFRGHERSEAEQEVYDFMQSKLHMSISGAGAAELWDPSDLEAPLIKTKRGDTEAQNVQKFTENWVSKELSKKGINYEKEMEKYDAAKKAYAKSDGMDIDQLYVMKETNGNLHRAMNKLDANKYKKDVTAYLRTQPVIKDPGETFGRSRVHEYVNGFKKHVLQLNAIAYQAGQVAEGITPGRKTRTPSRKTRGEEMLARMKATPVREIKFKGGRTVDVDALIARLSKEKKGKVRAREPVTMIARAKAKKYTGEKIAALREKAKRQKVALEKRAALKETRLAALEVKKAKREAAREARKEKKVALKEAKLAALEKKKATRMAKTEKMAVVREARKATAEKMAALRKTRLAALDEKRADAKEAGKKKKVALREARLAKQIELKTKRNAANAEKIAELAEAKANRLVKIRERREKVAEAKRARQDAKKARFAALRAEKEAKVAEKRAKREEILANKKVAVEAVEKKRLAQLEAKEKKEEGRRPLDERTKRLMANMRLDVPESKIRIGVPTKKRKKRETALTGREAVLHNNRELEKLVSSLEGRATSIGAWRTAAKSPTRTEKQREDARKRLAKFTEDYTRARKLLGQVDFGVRNTAKEDLNRLRGANLDAKKNI